MLKEFTAWFIDLVIKFLKSIGGVFYDVGVSVLEGILNALSGLITAIPAPSFLASASLGSLLSGLPDYVRYFVGMLRLTDALAILLAGFTFRMLRKIVTLGQW